MPRLDVRRLAAVDTYGTAGTQWRRRVITGEFIAGAIGCFALGLWVAFTAEAFGWRLFGAWLTRPEPCLPRSGEPSGQSPPTRGPCPGPGTAATAGQPAQRRPGRSGLPAAAVLPARGPSTRVHRTEGRSRVDQTAAGEIPSRRSQAGTVRRQDADHPRPHSRGAGPAAGNDWPAWRAVGMIGGCGGNVCRAWRFDVDR